jgi:hypothetical protein
LHITAGVVIVGVPENHCIFTAIFNRLRERGRERERERENHCTVLLL